jgi:putative transcriptional regulator
MDRKLFEQLTKSVSEAGQISRNEIKANRKFRFKNIDAKDIRLKNKLTQSEFAMMIGVSPRTLQNWEQGHRKPEGPALALLTIFKNDPKHAFNALHYQTKK